MEVKEILLIPATIIASVVLIASCLILKRLRRTARKESSVPDKTKSGKTKERAGNNGIIGITNTAFTVENADTDIYENDENVYDYAKTERGMGTKYRTNEKKFSENSPVYADANDTRFYFTLERASAKITDNDEGNYVIAIPDNVYDKPEDDETQHAKSQFYFTLEECCEQNKSNEQVSVETIVQQNKDADAGIRDTADETYQNGIQDVSIKIEEQQHGMNNDDDVYVINIPNDVNGESNKNGEGTIQTTEDMNVIEINERNDLSSQETEGDEYSRQIRTAEDNDDEYSEQSGTEEDNGSTQKRVKEDTLGQDCDEIYENVSECLGTENNEQEANDEEKMAYLDDEILPRKDMTEESDNEDLAVETLLSVSDECSNDSATRNNDERHFDDDIYENWEENIIGRVSGESREHWNESGDEMNSEKDSGDGFYENVSHFRPSMMMQEAR